MTAGLHPLGVSRAGGWPASDSEVCLLQGRAEGGGRPPSALKQGLFPAFSPPPAVCRSAPQALVSAAPGTSPSGWAGLGWPEGSPGGETTGGNRHPQRWEF